MSSTDAELTLTLRNVAELEEDDEFWAVISPDTPSMNAELTLTPGNLAAPKEDEEFWSAVSRDAQPPDAAKAG